MSEPIDTAAFGELIDDYQCAQLDGGLDERANARSALMNAYRAALGSSAAQSRDQWIDENVSGNKVLIQAMKNIADTASSDAQADGGKGEAVAWLYERDIDGPNHARYVTLHEPEESERVARAGYVVTPLTAQLAECKGEAVGVAGSMPGTDGFTMAAFKASDVPIGTKIYATPQAECVPREGLTDEQVLKLAESAWVNNKDDEQKFYLDFARAIEKAAKEKA
jgi:hypothetical protein